MVVCGCSLYYCSCFSLFFRAHPLGGIVRKRARSPGRNQTRKILENDPWPKNENRKSCRGDVPKVFWFIMYCSFYREILVYLHVQPYFVLSVGLLGKFEKCVIKLILYRKRFWKKVMVVKQPSGQVVALRVFPAVRRGPRNRVGQRGLQVSLHRRVGGHRVHPH